MNFAGASIAVDVLCGQSAVAVVLYGGGLAVLLAVIAFPEAAEAAWRSSWDGFVHRGAGPAPGSLIRIGAWFLLISVIVVHHYMTITGATDRFPR